MKDKKIKKLQEAIDTLQSQLDELKQEPKFEVGKWYCEIESPNNIIYYKGGGLEDYGTCYGVWDDLWGTEFALFPELYNLRPATEEEVEQALIKEAKNRGFKDGVVVDEVGDNCKGEVKILGNDPDLFSNNKKLMIGKAIVFNNGKWAKIIEEDKLVINGYEMKVDGDIVSFGCAKIDRYTIEDIIESTKENNKFIQKRGSNRIIKGITLDSGVEITIKDLEKIIDKLK